MDRLGPGRLTGPMITSHPLTSWLTIGATIAAGLATGLLYAFAVAVLPGLAQVRDDSFVAVMQAINRAILNPWFLLTFLGAPALAIAAVIGRFTAGGAGPWWPLIGGAALLVVSVLITAAVNVPLNNTLDAAGSADPAGVRAAFEGHWVSWNIARTVVSTLGFALLVTALAFTAG